MGDPRGFLKLGRKKDRERAIDERTRDYRELTIAAPPEEVAAQASRCMDCGIPFCHSPVSASGDGASSGCPLGNLIPEWNHLVYEGKLDEAAARLDATNNFPEITGRVCPAPCEAACVLNIEGEPVTIKSIERTIADHARAAGLVPRVAPRASGKSVAVVGSGPAGLAAAQELARMGHAVTVYEKDDRAGGLLRYGIPDFKLEKDAIDRRVEQMSAEGVRFVTGVRVGKDVPASELRACFDAIVVAIGARRARDIAIPGRELDGVHLAMDFLEQQNRRVANDAIETRAIVAAGKRVVVLGGGDTGSDCVGTSARQGAASVVQLELMPKPPLARTPSNPWPEWPVVLRTSSSHEEGAERDWAVQTRAFGGLAGRVTCLEASRVARENGRFVAIDGGALTIPCDLVLLALGFVGPKTDDVVAELGLALDARGNIAADPNGATNVDGIFACGDAWRGQSLVVWAIADGRRVARAVDLRLRSAPRARAAGSE